MEPGHKPPIVRNLWSIVHRCYRDNPHLSNPVDRRRWLYWLYQARRLYGFSVLNYTVLPTEVQLLVQDCGRGELPCSLHLLATNLATDVREHRRNSLPFWENRYDATLLHPGQSVRQLITQMDLAVVRYGYVSDPKYWRDCGYSEIQNPPPRARRLDFTALQKLLNPLDIEKLQYQRRQWVREAIGNCALEVNSKIATPTSNVRGSHRWVYRSHIKPMSPAPDGSRMGGRLGAAALVPKRFNT